MSKYFSFSLFFHLLLAGLVYLIANPIRLSVDRDHIAVSILLNAPSENAVSVRQSRPPKKRRERVDESSHYHADPGEKNAVIESPETHPQPPSVGGTGEAAESAGHRGTLDENSAYLKAVLEMVARVKRYPKLSQEREEQGLVLLAVTMKSDGTLVEVRAEQTTPFERLNNAAIETVRSLGKFPPPPAMGADLLTLHVPIRYKIEVR